MIKIKLPVAHRRASPNTYIEIVTLRIQLAILQKQPKTNNCVLSVSNHDLSIYLTTLFTLSLSIYLTVVENNKKRKTLTENATLCNQTLHTVGL